MKLVISLLFLFSNVTDSKGTIEQRCNKTRLCFLCGCGDESVFNISCKTNHVIQMETSVYKMRESDNASDCPKDYNHCRRTKSSTISTFLDRLQVYKDCTFQNSCEIKTRENITSVKYPFYCHKKSSILDISKEQAKNANNHILHFTGEKYVGQKIDCDCSVTSSIKILLEIYFIHLKPSTCSKVKFISETHQLFDCSTNDTTLLHVQYFDLGTDYKLQIRGMEPDVEDVLFFRLLGLNLSVNCSGCTNSTEDETAIDPRSDIVPTTTDISDIVPTTTEQTDTTADSPVPAASTDQTNTVATAALGGLLAAVIIINIVGIALYCFLRRRRKQKKSRNTLANASGNDVQYQYNYIDITQDTHGSSSTNGTVSNVVHNGDPGKSSDSIEGIPKTSDSKDRPNNQYHVLEVDTNSAPPNTRAKQKAGKESRQKDDYDHISDGSKFKPIINDTYNHIHVDAKMAVPRDATLNNTSASDNYDHIGNQKGLSKDKVGGQHESRSYVNVNLKPHEAPSTTEDVDTYNHLQN